MVDDNRLPGPAQTTHPDYEDQRQAYPVMTNDLAQYMYGGELHGHYQRRHGRYTQIYPVQLPHTDSQFYPAVQRAKQRQKEDINRQRHTDLIARMARRREPVVPVRDPLKRFRGVMVPDPRNHYRAMNLRLPNWRM